MRIRLSLFWSLLAGVAFLAQPSRLHAQSASATNRVLDLDGNGGNVELPPMIFTNLTESTIEAWVKFGTRDQTRFYSYGGMQGDLCIGRVNFNQRQISFFVNSESTGGKLDLLSVPDDIRIGRWYHVAAVSSTNGMRLHLNGVLVATNDVPKGFNSTTNGPHNIGLIHPFADRPSFSGQVDEFRVWKVARSTEQIRQTMGQPLTGNEPGLAALWNFDDPAQPGKDASTNGYNGKLRETARTMELKPVAGTPFAAIRPRMVLDLDGNDSYAELPPNIFTNLQNATIEARVRWFSFREHSRVFDFGASGSDINVQNRFRNPTLHYEMDTPTQHDVAVQNILRPGQWVHVAAVSGSNGMKLYYNGILVGTNEFNGTIASLTNALQRNLLGRSNWKVENPGDADFHGQIDELRVWSVERTASEILQNADADLSGSETNLVGLWTFDDGTVRDLTSRTNNGKLAGNAKIVSVADSIGSMGGLATLAVSGKAVLANGRPVASSPAWLEREGRSVARTVTDAAGNYRLLVSAPSGEIDLCVQSGDLGARKTLIFTDSALLNEDLTAVANVSFAGSITSFGERNMLAGVIVQAVKVQAGGSPNVVATINTDETGGYKFTNLKSGDYQLRYQIATGFDFFEKGKVFKADERNPILGLSVKLGPFKRGVWRPFSVGGSQSSQGFQGTQTANDSAAVLVESSGMIWASSSMGAMRFDGREITLLTAYQNGLADNRVRSLFREPDGTMWFGTEGGATRWDGKARNFTSTNGLPPGAIRTIARSPDGTLWFGGNNGLARYGGKQFTRFTATNGLPVATVNQIAVAKDGTVWLAIPVGLGRFENDRFVPAVGDEVTEANAVMIAGDGSVWCGTPAGVVRLVGIGERGKGGKGEGERGTIVSRLTTYDGLIDDRVTAIHEMKDGTMWFGTEAGLSRYDGTNFVNYVAKDGLAYNGIASLASSPDGVLWVGCMNGAVCSFDPKTFSHYGLADGMVAPGLGPGTVDRNGTVWTGNWIPRGGTQRALYSIGISGVTNHPPVKDDNWINNVSIAPDGSVWAGTQGGLMRSDGTTVTYFTQTNGLPKIDCSSLAWDQAGTMYVNHYQGGITRYDGKVFEPMPLSSGTWPGNILKMRMYSTNEFWLCSWNGLWLYDGNTVTAYTNGLPSQKAWDVFKEKEGAYLVGTDSGAARFDGKRFGTVYTAAKDRLSDNVIWFIFRDSKGVLWFAGWGDEGGVTRWDGKVWSTLSIPDGLSGRDIRWIGEGPNGVYWFATENGMTRYQPSTNAPVSPRLEIAADQDYKDREELPPVFIGQRMSFKYNATDFRTRSETRRYRWQICPGALLATALPAASWTEGTSSTQFEWVPNKPGDYTVAIQYVDRDLNYSEPTVRRFTIKLPWTQNAWIVVPAGGSIVGLFGTSIFFGLRYVSKRREAERLKAEMFEQERKTRIALENKNVQLERARDVAEAASRTKSVFLANMSHELRTPLTAIIGFTEILQDEAKAEGKAEQEEDLDRIYDSAKHLLGLINGILDLSKIEAQKMELHLENFSIKTLVNDVASMLRPLVSKKENKLVIECAADIGEMYADLSKVRQCLLNLLGNANKFTEKGVVRLEVKQELGSPSPRPSPPGEGEPKSNSRGSERVSLAEGQPTIHPLPRGEGRGEGERSSLHSQPSTINFVVTDTGIGMSREQMEKLFEAFAQGESSTARKYGGTGLGLTITKHFAEMMKGTVAVESELGKGSTFTLTLPVEVEAPSVPEPTGLPGDERPAELGQCLLVIDDDPNVHRLIERTLQPEGFVIRSAMDGKAGLKMARELKPALITLDVMMPHTDGWSVLSALKSDPDLCNIPVVMLSIIGEKELGFALGASDYLIKPVDRGQLLAALKKYLPEPHGTHVLIVEDDPNLRELLRRMLEAENIDVVEAENGAIGIEKIRERIPGLILLDLMMPVMDGFAVLAELHRTPQWQRIPVVVVTAKELNEADRMQIIRQSDAIVQKGALSKEDLLREINQLVKKYEQKSGLWK